MELTAEQRYILYKIVTDIKAGKPQCRIGGFAGVGKSFLAGFIAKFFPQFGVCAYTGKAANVLRKKGMPAARTIHSLIYRPLTENNQLIGFALASPEELGCLGFIVDEGSMVGRDLYDDLRSYELPMIIIGDHGQLEPINSSFNLMEHPDYALTHIHRNAGNIAHFAEHLRYGRKALTFRECQEVQFINQRQIAAADFLKVDQVICAYNKTRVETNAIVREAYGYTGLLNEGERVTCLKNNRACGLFNGMQGIVRNLYEDGKTGRTYMDFESNGYTTEDIWYDTRFFGQEKMSQDYFRCGGTDNPNPFDYAYCLTAHRCQGDEFNNVMVLEQQCRKWDNSRWNYTSASRAKQNLIWAY